MNSRRVSACLIGFLSVLTGALPCSAAPTKKPPLPLVEGVAAQPLLAQARRATEAMEHLGSPLSSGTRVALAKASQAGDDARVARAVQAALDPYCLLLVSINPESRVKVAP